MPRIVFTMLDGSTLEGEFTKPALIDQVAFERHFKMSSAVLDAAGAATAAYAEAQRIGGEAGELFAPDPRGLMRAEWMAFFGWRCVRRQLGPAVPAHFDVFLEAVDGMDIIADPEPEAIDEDEDDGAPVEREDGSLDPPRADQAAAQRIG